MCEQAEVPVMCQDSTPHKWLKTDFIALKKGGTIFFILLHKLI